MPLQGLDRNRKELIACFLPLNLEDTYMKEAIYLQPSRDCSQLLGFHDLR